MDSVAAARAIYEHKLPKLGLADEVYDRRIKRAEEAGDRAARAAHKVGLYLTHAQSIKLRWDDKRELLERALHRHCHAPLDASPELQAYLKALSDLVREVAGTIALKHATVKDDLLANRRASGTPCHILEADAEDFFDDLLGFQRGYTVHTSIFREAEYAQLVMIRNQWL